MPEQLGAYTWALEDYDTTYVYRFDPQTYTVSRNDDVRVLSEHASKVLGILIHHVDAPVLPADFLEAGLTKQGGHSLHRAIEELKANDITSPHILEIGANARAVYGFLANPGSAELFHTRLGYMYETLAADMDSVHYQQQQDTLRKLGVISSAIAASVTGYVVAHYVTRHKRSN
ncbi:MAG: hypothetical protein KIH63_003105 [Candidatus Saccharibacteria bacterium]|nr:hypothetical protein [Candidatus Saccharibacteria bacterium]